MAKPKTISTTPARSRPQESATREDVTRICGDLPDWKVAAILRIGPTSEELEEAGAWLSGESDLMGKERKKLAGRVGQVWDVVGADEEPDDDPTNPPGVKP
jgi:hypothetical protein